MNEYKREYPIFSLCGLNCGLCARYHTEGSSRCPGCGGENFHIQHPSCAVISCSKKHGQVEFCFQCTSYPCDRYQNRSELDSFISYRNVISDFEKARTNGIQCYISMLEKKMEILDLLIKKYNDGKSKGFYCIAVNLLELDTLQYIMKRIRQDIDCEELLPAAKSAKIKSLFETEAAKAGVDLKLRKK